MFHKEQGVGISNESVTRKSSVLKNTWSKTTSHTKILKKKSRSLSVASWVKLGTVAVITLLFATSHLVSRVSSEPRYVAPSARLEDPIGLQAVLVDEVVAAGVAAVVAQEADLLITPNVTDRAITLDTQATMAAQAEEGTTPQLEKPQIIADSQAVRTITVKDGDTIASLAREHGISQDTIRWANNLSTNTLQPGAKLTILPVSGVLYTVRTGDTVENIASTYRASAEAIKAFNDVEIKGLRPGSRIIIPNGIRPSASAPAPQARTYYQPVYAGNRYGYGYCTYYTYNKRAEIGRPVPSFLGNGRSWAYNAQQAGFRVNKTPAAGAVFQTGAGYSGYGHVGFVERVNSDGSIFVSEMNYVGWNVVSTRTISASEVSLYNYIH